MVRGCELHLCHCCRMFAQPEEGFVQQLHNAYFAEYLHNMRRVCTKYSFYRMFAQPERRVLYNNCNFCRIFAQPCTTCRVFAQPENGLYGLHICTFCRIFAQPAEVVGAMCTHGLVMIGATSLSILSAPPPPCHRRRGRPSHPPPLPLLHELFKDAWLVDM